MPLDMTTLVTGATVVGLTSPTYTLSADQAPNNNARSSIVTALGGTQAGVTTHSVSDPFTITATRAKSLIMPPKANPMTGVVGQAGVNKVSVLIRKGTKPLVGQNPQVSSIRIDCSVIAGAEVNDASNVAALYSSAAAFLFREANNLNNASKTGTI